MADDKIFRCDCGYRLRARTEQRQVAEVRRHAWEAHGISFSTEEALAVLLRLELELDEMKSADLAMVKDTTKRREQR
jgi:predicted small metal-binding protein